MNIDGDIDGSHITSRPLEPVHRDDAFGQLDALCRQRHWSYRVGHVLNARGNVTGFLLRVYPLDSLPLASGFQPGHENEAAAFILMRVRELDG